MQAVSPDNPVAIGRKPKGWPEPQPSLFPLFSGPEKTISGKPKKTAFEKAVRAIFLTRMAKRKNWIGLAQVLFQQFVFGGMPQPSDAFFFDLANPFTGQV